MIISRENFEKDVILSGKTVLLEIELPPGRIHPRIKEFNDLKKDIAGVVETASISMQEWQKVEGHPAVVPNGITAARPSLVLFRNGRCLGTHPVDSRQAVQAWLESELGRKLPSPPSRGPAP